MPPDAFEAFRGAPQEFLAMAVTLADGLSGDAELSVKVTRHQSVRRITFEMEHGDWHFTGFVRPKSGEIVLERVNWGGAQ